MNYIKENIKYLKEKDKNLYKIIGIQEQSLRNILSDKNRKVSLEIAIKISEYYKISLEDLIKKKL